MGDGWFDGVISSYDEIEKLYRVTYVKDGDIEDYDSNQIHELVHQYTQKDVVLDDLTSQQMKELEGIPLDLADFEDYLYYKDGSTHSNIRQIYSRAELLQKGTGVAYNNWKEGVVFAKDVPITDLSTDFKKLREDAKQYALDHGEDKSHGKALTIPLNKLNDYQKHFYFKIFVPTLSEKRRNELAEIKFELSKFQEFLGCQEAGLNRDQNTIQEIVAKVEMLQKGRGIPLSNGRGAGNKGVVFRPKPFVYLSEDFHSLLREAKEYETLHVGRRADTLSSYFSLGLTILIQPLIDYQKNFYFKEWSYMRPPKQEGEDGSNDRRTSAAVSAAAAASSSSKKRKGALDHGKGTAEETEDMETSDDDDNAINNGERKSKRKARRKMMKQLKSPPYEEPRHRSKSSSGKRKARDQGKPQGEEASETSGPVSKKRQRADVNDEVNIVCDVADDDDEAKKVASVESGNGEWKSEPGAGCKTNEKLYSELSDVQRSLLKGVKFEVAKFKRFLAEEEKLSATTQYIYGRIAQRLVLGAGVEHDKWPTTFHPTPVDFGDDFVKLYKNANSFHKLHGRAIDLRSTIRKLGDYQKFYFHKILGKTTASAAMRDQQAGSQNAAASLQDTTGSVPATGVVDKDQPTDSSESKQDELCDKQGRPIGNEHLEAMGTLGQQSARVDDKEQNTSNDEPMENARTLCMDNRTKHGLSDDDGIGQDESASVKETTATTSSLQNQPSASTAGIGPVAPIEVGNENQPNGSIGDENDGASLEAGVSKFSPDIIASLEQPMVSISDGIDTVASGLECNTTFVQQLIVGALVSLNGRHGKVTRGLSSEGKVVVKLFHENREVEVKPEYLKGTTDESTKTNAKKNWETEPTMEKQNGEPTPDEANS